LSVTSLRQRNFSAAFGHSSRATPTDALGTLLAHRDELPRAAGARLAIFARGFEPELERRAGEEGVALIGAEDLFTSG